MICQLLSLRWPFCWFPCDFALLLNKLCLSAQELEDKIRETMDSIQGSMPEACGGDGGGFIQSKKHRKDTLEAGTTAGSGGEAAEERGEEGSLIHTRQRSAEFDETQEPGQALLTNDFSSIRFELQVLHDLSTTLPAIALYWIRCACDLLLTKL